MPAKRAYGMDQDFYSRSPPQWIKPALTGR